MTFEKLTTLAPAEILARAKQFFSERVPHNAAYPEKEGPMWLQLRGQGGEEIAIGVMEAPGGWRVRAGTLLFDQAVDRFLSTLPAAEPVTAASAPATVDTPSAPGSGLPANG